MSCSESPHSSQRSDDAYIADGATAPGSIDLGGSAGEDRIEKVRSDKSRYIHTRLLEVLLECICNIYTKNDMTRQNLLDKLCNSLSESKLINHDLLCHTLPLRNQIRKTLMDFIKEVSQDDDDVDLTSICSLESISTKLDNFFHNNFELLQEIGKGAFGSVCKVKNLKSNSIFAVKRILFNYRNDSRLLRVLKEVKSIKLLNHINVVRYEYAWTEPPSDNFEYGSDLSSSDSDSDKSVNWNIRAVLYILMEYCNCDLRLWLEEKAHEKPVPFEMNIMDMLMQILCGMDHIHSHKIIHRDLKPQNILYAKSSNTLKIGDFGLSTLTCCIENESDNCSSCHHTTFVGTIPYAAPEMFKHESYDTKVDIYSLGIIMIELLNTFRSQMELSKAIENIKLHIFPIEMKQSRKLMYIVSNLLNEDPRSRLPAREILNYLEEDVKACEIEGKLQERDAAINEIKQQILEKEADVCQAKAVLQKKQKELDQLKDLLVKTQLI